MQNSPADADMVGQQQAVGSAPFHCWVRASPRGSSIPRRQREVKALKDRLEEELPAGRNARDALQAISPVVAQWIAKHTPDLAEALVIFNGTEREQRRAAKLSTDIMFQTIRQELDALPDDASRAKYLDDLHLECSGIV